MKMKLALAGIGIILIIGISTGWYLYNKPHTGVENVSTDVTITAVDLYDAFQQNETLANNKYLNKVIEVTGKVSDIQNTNGVQLVLLSADAAMGGISCKLSSGKNSLENSIKKGSLVTIKGKCSGYLMDVNLVDCLAK